MASLYSPAPGNVYAGTGINEAGVPTLAHYDGHSWATQSLPGVKGWGIYNGVASMDGTGPHDIWAYAVKQDATAVLSAALIHTPATDSAV